MTILDTIVFLVFTGGIVLFGCSFFSKKRTSDEFTSAGRSLPGWVVGMSIFATYVSSISYLAYPGKSYMEDWNAFVFSLSIPIASYFAARYFVPFYRSIGSVSAYSFLEMRFGIWARSYASFCYLLTQIARMGSILYLLALPMNALLGWDIYYNYGYSNYPIFNAWWIEGSYMDRSYSRLHFDMWGTDLYAYLVVRYAGGSQTDV